MVTALTRHCSFATKQKRHAENERELCLVKVSEVKWPSKPAQNNGAAASRGRRVAELRFTYGALIEAVGKSQSRKLPLRGTPESGAPALRKVSREVALAVTREHFQTPSFLTVNAVCQDTHIRMYPREFQTHMDHAISRCRHIKAFSGYTLRNREFPEK